MFYTIARKRGYSHPSAQIPLNYSVVLTCFVDLYSKDKYCLLNNNKKGCFFLYIMNKKELRTQIKRYNKAVSPQERVAAAKAVFAKVEASEAFRDAECVGFFSALPDELATDEFLDRWSAMKRIVVPKVDGDEMDFFEFSRAKMSEGAFGIMEPAADARLVDPSQIDLMVVPGVAFTLKGARMGRGRGYYDKYLSRAGFRAVKVGVCYAHQIVDDLPVEPHDIFMDFVVHD